MSETEPDTVPQPAPAVSALAPAVKASSARVALAWLALLVAIAALAGAGVLWRLIEQGEQRLRNLERAAAERPAAANPARVDELARRGEAMEAALAALDRRAGAVEEAQRALQQATAQAGSADRELGEAEYLQRLAAQSLLMGREVRGAIALLTASDEILRAHDDPALHEARARLAQDLAALREVADFDVEGTWLRLAALESGVATLATAERTEPVPENREPAPQETGWGARIEALLARFVTVRRDAPAVRPLMTEADEQLVRLDIRLALEQAKLAVLAGEQAVYAAALADAAQLAREYFGEGTGSDRAFQDELARLATLRVAPELPDLSGSLQALRAARAHAAPAG